MLRLSSDTFADSKAMEMPNMSNNKPLITSRRRLLQSAGAGFGSLALAGLLGEAAAKQR